MQNLPLQEQRLRNLWSEPWLRCACASAVLKKVTSWRLTPSPHTSPRTLPVSLTVEALNTYSNRVVEMDNIFSPYAFITNPFIGRGSSIFFQRNSYFCLGRLLHYSKQLHFLSLAFTQTKYPGATFATTRKKDKMYSLDINVMTK